MRAYWKHFVYLMKHKWFVLVECVKLGIAWRGLVHDLSGLLVGGLVALVVCVMNDDLG
jgi:hypothetical protein